MIVASSSTMVTALAHISPYRSRRWLASGVSVWRLLGKSGSFSDWVWMLEPLTVERRVVFRLLSVSHGERKLQPEKHN